MPAFNAESTIQLSINSVLEQTYKNWELVIVNDASTDNTQKIINKNVINDKRIVALTLSENGGLPNARNVGITKAKGKFIAFLDSDDIWYSDKLTTQLAFHDKNPNIKISHTAFDIFNDAGILKRPFKGIADIGFRKNGLLLPSIYIKNTVGVLTVMAETDLLKSVGGFDVKLWTMEDQDLWIRIAELNEPFGYVENTLAKYRISSNGITNKVGKYKKAYRKFIDKYRVEMKRDNVYKSVLANYYRYFALIFLKKGSYKIAFYYGIKAVKIERNLIQKTLSFLLLIRIRLKLVKL